MSEELYTVSGTFVQDNLIAGQEVDLLTAGITLAKNQGVIKRGTVLGIITASGLAQIVDSTKADGTQNPNCVLADDVDTGSGAATADFPATAYVQGLFNSKALIFGGTDTADKHETELRRLGIFLRENITL